MLAMLMAASCETTTGTSVNRDLICGNDSKGIEGLLRPIYWADEDTDETIRQVKERNAEWGAVCGANRQSERLLR